MSWSGQRSAGNVPLTVKKTSPSPLLKSDQRSYFAEGEVVLPKKRRRRLEKVRFNERESGGEEGDLRGGERSAAEDLIDEEAGEREDQSTYVCLTELLF